MTSKALGRPGVVRGPAILRVLRHPVAGWTLKRRLVVILVATVALLGIVIGLVAVLALQSFLVTRLDRQVDEALGRGIRAAYSAQQGASARQNFGTIIARLSASGRGGDLFLFGVTGTRSLTAYTSEYTSELSKVPADTGPISVDLHGTLGRYRVEASRLPDGTRLIAGLPLADVDATTGRLIAVLVIVTLVAVIVSVLIGLGVISLALRPLGRVTTTAQRIATLPLDRGEVPVAVGIPDRDTDQRTEVGRVGSAVNRMLGHVLAALASREASERKVRRFVADASHELRTPLASIRGYAELTRMGAYELPDDVVRSLGRIESEATRMTAIVEDLLLLARLDEGRELDREAVDPLPLLIDAVSDAHAAGREHNFSLELPDEPVIITGDAQRLQQVFVNLLGNARVHTPPGTRVTIAAFREGDSVIITVTDDGPGIPAELADTLFERFARGDVSRSRETGSTGLGLAIVRAVVEAQGGSVGVTSLPGATTFRVELPLAAVPAVEPPS